MSYPYLKYVRRRSFARLRYGNVLKSYLAAQAARLKLTGAGVTFTATAGTDQCTMTAHGKLTGDGPFEATNAGGALPAGMAVLTKYWFRRIDANNVTLHTSKASAIANTGLVDITDAGTGTHTFKKSADNQSIFDRLKAGKKSRTVEAAINIDNL